MKHLTKLLLLALILISSFGINAKPVMADYVPTCDPRQVNLNSSQRINCVPSVYWNDDPTSRVAQQCTGALTPCQGTATFCKSGHPNISTGIISCYSPGQTIESPTCPPVSSIPGLPPGTTLDAGLPYDTECKYKGNDIWHTEYARRPKNICTTGGYQYLNGQCVPTSSSGMQNFRVYLCKGGLCNTALGAIPTDTAQLIGFIVKIIMGLSGGLLILSLVRGGYMLATSTGDPQKLNESKEIITSAIIGFSMLMLSFVLLNAITSDLLKLPGITP